MLEPIFGNATAEKVLLYLFQYGEGYARLISRVFDVPVNGINQQMRRLEDGGVISGISRGRTRLFRINPRYPFKRELCALLRKAMEYVPEEDKERYFRNRARPRRRGKPL